MNLNGTSEETLDLIRKAQTNGVTTASGIVGVDLGDLISLIPVNTPFLDSIARTRPSMGAPFATWRALTNVTNLQSDPGTAFDYAAPLASLNELDVTAKYAKLGFGYTVTQDAIDQAQGFANARAIAVQNAMNMFKIGADRKLLGGQNFALTTPGTPSVQQSDTGGNIAASTAVNVKVAARTLSNYFYGGSTAASAQGSVTTSTVAGSTHSATASVAAVVGAVAYDWFVGGFYYTTTTVNKVTITSIPTANQAVPSGLPGLYGTAPASVPASDGSAKSTDFNGLLASLAGDYATGGATGLVTRGSGTNSGAYFNSLDGAQFTVSGQNVAEIDALNANIFNQIQTSPTRYLVSSQEANSISKLVFANAGGGTNYFAGTDKNRSDVVAGGFIGHYINKAAGGVPVPLQVMPNLAPGTLIAVTDSLPFPSSNVSSTLEFRVLHDVQDWEYPAARNSGVAGGGPRFDGEVFATGTLTNKAPVACGVISNISAS